MEKKEIVRQYVKDLLFVVFAAGFDYGANHVFDPKVGLFKPFEKLIAGEEFAKDCEKYDIKSKVDYLLNLTNDITTLLQSHEELTQALESMIKINKDRYLPDYQEKYVSEAQTALTNAKKIRV